MFQDGPTLPPPHTLPHHTNSAAAKESGQGVRTFAAAAAAANSPVQLPDLPYGYGELEPVISGGKECGLDWIGLGRGGVGSDLLLLTCTYNRNLG